MTHELTLVANGPPVVLVDMDGVLCAFVERAYECCGVPADHIDLLQEKIARWDDVHVPLHMTPDQMWAKIDDWGEHFWSHMKWRRWGLRTLRKAEALGDVYLCSSPSKHPGSRSGKAKWVLRHIPEYERKLILMKDKHLLAGPGRILIDDSPRNCRDFIDHGGQALLVTHPYNRNADLPRFEECA